MKCEVKVTDITMLCDGLNNAMISFGDIIGGIIFGLDVPDVFKELAGLQIEDLKPRIEAVKDIYSQLLDYEKKSDYDKIELEIENIKDACDGLNNSIIAYHEIVTTIYLGCQVPVKLEGLRKVPHETLEKRVDILKNFYTQLIEIEKEVKE